MAEHAQDTRLTDVLERLTQSGLDGLSDALRVLLNAAMLLERERYLGASHDERTPDRRGHANGFKPKTLSTRVGQLELSVPQVRDGGFYPSSPERGSRSERALKLALAEMYVQGVSTRKVAAITEQLCGFEVSSPQVSRATAELDEVFDEWRRRPLGEFADANFICKQTRRSMCRASSSGGRWPESCGRSSARRRARRRTDCCD